MKLAYVIATAVGLGLAAAQLQRHCLEKRIDIVTVTVWKTVESLYVIVVVGDGGDMVSKGAAAATLPTTTPIRYPQTSSVALAEALTIPEHCSQGVALPAPAATSLSSAISKAMFIPAETPDTKSPVKETLTSETRVKNHTSNSEILASAPSVAPTYAPLIPNQVDNNSTPPSYGIGWSGYKGNQGNSTCKSMNDADNDWSRMNDFGVVRVYGTDCDQPSNALQLAKKYNKKVFMGVYWLDIRLPQEIQTIIDAVQSSGVGWKVVDTIGIGNEDVHRGEMTADQIFGAISSAKIQLQAAGYKGPVVHVDSQEAILANPDLCSLSAGDYIAVNVHPFFNSQTSADQAGDFVQGQIALLKQCGASKRSRRDDIRIRVTETGWPTKGDVNGAAVPSKNNQNIAVSSIKNKISGDVIMFSAFNNFWMSNDPSTFNTEHYWGLLDD